MARRVLADHRPMSRSSSLLASLLCLNLLACSGDPEASFEPAPAPAAPAEAGPLRLAVMMPPTPDGTSRPAIEWALAAVNEAGGVAGRRLEVDYVAYDPADPASAAAVGQGLAWDAEHVAVIGPGTSSDLAAVADEFVSAKKPLVSFTSTAADLLRAHGGKGAIWRTRESDIGQTELLLHQAQKSGAKRIALLTSLGPGGSTFFSWFGFFAQELGYPEDAVVIAELPEGAPCEESVKAALEATPDTVIIAAGGAGDLECALRTANPPDMPPGAARPWRIVVADTGLDTPATLANLGALADGVEGLSPVPGPEEFAQAFEQGTGQPLGPHGAGEYDAVLLLAYGLQASQGKGGAALVAGIQAAVDGREGSYGWDAAGIAGALAAMRAGGKPDISGATGPLEFEPKLAMDLASSYFSRWVWEGGQRSFKERYWTGDAAFRSSGGVFVAPGADQLPDLGGAGSGWAPATEKADLWAVVASLSSGWSNYRHQADALRHYQLLRARGVPDDHIVFISADDVAHAPQNRLAGAVRNEPGGEDLREGAEIDYDLSLGAAGLVDVLLGRESEATPRVIKPTASSNVYVFLAGHGGQQGIPIGASTASEGIDGGGDVLSPDMLRSAFCALRSEGRLRRGLVVIESCFSGAFGGAEFQGLEAGCDGVPLDGVTLMTAASSDEVSYAASYDDELRAWVNDAFSHQFASVAGVAPGTPLTELYRDVFLNVQGSHASLFNKKASGRISDVQVGEFLSP